MTDLLIAGAVIVVLLILVGFLVNKAEYARKAKEVEEQQKIKEQEEELIEQQKQEKLEFDERMKKFEYEKWNNRIRVISEPVLTIGEMIINHKQFIIDIDEYPYRWSSINGCKEAVIIDENNPEIRSIIYFYTNEVDTIKINYGISGAWDWMTQDEGEYLYKLISDHHEENKKIRLEQQQIADRQKYVDLYCIKESKIKNEEDTF